MKVLFATSNGTGLGHLNRAMSIARRLPAEAEVVIFTLSQAVPAVVSAGFRVEYAPSYRRPGSGSDWQWNLRLRRRFERLLDRERPDAVVFDGVHPYRAITHVLGADGAPPSAWCRRPLWRAGSSTAPLKRTGSFDLVLEPGELAAERDPGPTVERREEALRLDPIVFLDPGELLSREAAAAELGLDPGKPTALVNLGQGGEVDEAVRTVLARLSDGTGTAAGELQIAALESSIGAGLTVPDGVVRLRATFPMSRYFAAFDLAVAAAGYNAFHELVAFSVPSLFVPMPRNTDDQGARAAWAQDSGAGLAVSGPADPDLAGRVGSLLDPDVRSGLAGRCRELWPGNGAHAAADAVVALARGEQPGPAVRDRRALNRWLHSSSHPVGPSLPLALGLTARDLLGHPDRRRPRLAVVAIGIEPGRLEAELEGAIDAAGAEPGRTLVLTDSLDFPLLRRLGVGIERVPAAAEAGHDPGAPAYRELAESRLAEALGRRAGRVPTTWLEPDAGAPASA